MMYLALTLSTIPMDRGTRKLEIVKVIVQTIACAFRLDEHQGPCRRLLEQKIHQTLFFIELLDENDLLVSCEGFEQTR